VCFANTCFFKYLLFLGGFHMKTVITVALSLLLLILTNSSFVVAAEATYTIKTPCDVTDADPLCKQMQPVLTMMMGHIMQAKASPNTEIDVSSISIEDKKIDACDLGKYDHFFNANTALGIYWTTACKRDIAKIVCTDINCSILILY
jgi:hypothetical protein